MSNRGSGKYEQLLDRCKNLEAIPTAVVHPCKASALAGAMESADKGLIRPILVGPAARIFARSGNSTRTTHGSPVCRRRLVWWYLNRCPIFRASGRRFRNPLAASCRQAKMN